jgi:hypothetical protein
MLTDHLKGSIKIPADQLERARAAVSSRLSQLQCPHPDNAQLDKLVNIALNLGATHPDDTFVFAEIIDGHFIFRFVCNGDPNLASAVGLFQCLSPVAGAVATADTYHGHRYVLYHGQVTELQGEVLFLNDPSQYDADDLACLAQIDGAQVQILKMVAANPNCPAAALVRLLQNPDSDVAKTAADNPNTPPYALAMYQLADS